MDEPTTTLDELLQPGTTVMVGTADPELRFRPLTVARVRDAAIDILVDGTEDWAAGLHGGDPAHVTLSDNRDNTWASLRGRASIRRDDAIVDEVWNPLAAAFFDDGRDTPGIAVLTVDVDEGRYWSSPSGRIGNLVSMVRAAVRGSDRSGEHGDVDV
jgi:general stress protein 26